jgi:hypothetical protein
MDERFNKEFARIMKGSVFLTIDDERIVRSVDTNIDDACNAAATHSCTRIVQITSSRLPIPSVNERYLL